MLRKIEEAVCASRYKMCLSKQKVPRSSVHVGRVFVALCVALVLCIATFPAVRAIPGVSLGQDFALRLGQSATVAGAQMTVTFRAVLKDSRCPVDVGCFWAGNGKAALDVVDAEGHSMAINLNTELEPRAARVGSYELRLVSLAPDPVAGVRIPQGEYIVTLRVVEI